MDVRRIVDRIRMSPYGERRIGVTLDNLGGRDEGRDVGRPEEGSNTGPYVLLALALAWLEDRQRPSTCR